MNNSYSVNVLCGYRWGETIDEGYGLEDHVSQHGRTTRAVGIVFCCDTQLIEQLPVVKEIEHFIIIKTCKMPPSNAVVQV